MADRDDLRGVVTPMATPFRDDLEIDLGLYAEHALKMLADGCVGVTPFGTTGEALSIGVGERMAALEHLAAAGVPPARMVPGAGLCNEHETAHLIDHATEIGCAGVLVLPPFYYKDASEDGIAEYFRRLIGGLKHAPRILLYHIPQVAGVGISPALAARIRDEHSDVVVGIKDSAGDWSNTAELLRIDGLRVYPGSEHGLLRALDNGAAGVITASGNTHAATIAALFADGDRAALDARGAVVDALRSAFNPYPLIAALKWLLAERTGTAGWRRLRPPLTPLDDAAGRALAAELDRLS